MNFKLVIFLVMAAMVAVCIPSGLAEVDAAPPVVGGVLPPIELGIPQSPEYRQYLGLRDGTTFTIPEIQAEIVLIEIFSMY